MRTIKPECPGAYCSRRRFAAVTSINRLNEEITRYVHFQDVQAKFLAVGVESIGSSPDYLATTIKYEINRLGKGIRKAGIRAE